jgi:hypothetical protein
MWEASIGVSRVVMMSFDALDVRSRRPVDEGNVLYESITSGWFSKSVLGSWPDSIWASRILDDEGES